MGVTTRSLPAAARRFEARQTRSFSALPSAARDKWLSILQSLIQLPQKFVNTSDVQDRQSILIEAQTLLQSIGAKPKTGDRFLYAILHQKSSSISWLFG